MPKNARPASVLTSAPQSDSGPSSRPRPRRHIIEDVGSLRLFAAVMETQNLSQAARRLALTPSTASKRLSDLEARLGTTLISRTTRRLAVTAAGRTFHEYCLRVLHELDEAEAEMLDYNQVPRGHLRITAPTVLAVRHISPRLPDFMRRYPGISIEFVLTSRLIDLMSEAIDVAVRVMETPESGSTAERLCANRRVCCAAPAYLERFGTPRTPEELSKHNCLIAKGEIFNNVWSFKKGNRTKQVRVSGNFVADNGELIRDAVAGGLGIARLPAFLIGQDLKDGTVREVLAPHMLQNTALYAVLPHSRPRPRKQEVFVSFLKELFSPAPPWDL